MTDAEILQFLKNKFGAAKRGNKDWIRFRCPTCNPHDAAKMKRGLKLSNLASHCFICKQPLSIQQIFGHTNIVPSFSGALEPEVEHPQARILPCESFIPISALPEDHPAVKFLNADHLTDRTQLYLDHKVAYILPEDAHKIIFERDNGDRYSIFVGDSLVFPVMFNGELVGWQCRFIPGTIYGDKMKKMKYLHVFPKGNYLYNYDNAKQYNNVVVVEGIKKSWKFPNSVATLGKGISPKQIELIQHWEEIIFMYDGEDETQEKVKELVDAIKLNKKCINIDPRDYGFDSPDEMTSEEAQIIAYTEWIKAYGE